MDKEKQWIKKIKRNANHFAANELISKYYKEIYAFMYKQTLDAELSLDLTQEVFISVLKTIGGYDDKKALFRTWLYKVASNRLVDYYRSRHYKYNQLAVSLEEFDFDDGKDIIISLEYKQDIEKVTYIINQLNASSQQIMRLKLFGEYTLQEIAEMENIPLSTVKTRYYSALKPMKQILKGGYVSYE